MPVLSPKDWPQGSQAYYIGMSDGICQHFAIFGDGKLLGFEWTELNSLWSSPRMDNKTEKEFLEGVLIRLKQAEQKENYELAEQLLETARLINAISNPC